MRIIAICGSPRKESNTEFYLNTVLNCLKYEGAETQLISLREKSINECRACYGCVEAKKCVVEDDFQEIFNSMISADGILLGSPVYHSSITPKLKALLDRAGFSGRWYSNEMKKNDQAYSWSGNAFSGKVVAPVSIARRAGHNFTFAQLLLWATCNECIIPGSSYWNVGTAGKGGAVDASEDEEGCTIMKQLAVNMYKVIHALKADQINGGKRC